MFTSYDLLNRALMLSSKCPTLNTIIYVEAKVKSHREHTTVNNNILPSHMRLIPFSKLYDDGKKILKEFQLDPFDFSDVSWHLHCNDFTRGHLNQARAIENYIIKQSQLN